MNTHLLHDPEYDQYLMEIFSSGAYGMILEKLAFLPHVVTDEANNACCAKQWLAFLEQHVLMTDDGGIKTA